MTSESQTRKLSQCCFVAALCLGSTSVGAATTVDLELGLLVDVSGSVDSGEYDLQKGGYISAFRNTSIQNSIANLSNGIAVSYIEWSGVDQQAQLVDWTHITDSSSSEAFADSIENEGRAFSGQTGIAAAIDYGASEILTNDFEGSRVVLDVSGDGTDNEPGDPSTSRDDALDRGVTTINGLPIGGGNSLFDYYNANVVGGSNAFIVQASSFEDVETAVVDKIGREITGTVPVPATLPLIGLGLLGFAASRRRSA